MDKDGVEALRVEGMHSPNVERDIDLDGEEFVLLGAPIEGVPTEGQGQVPVTSPSDVPEVESWFIARWNEIADITGRPWLKVTTLTEDQLVVLASHPKALVSDALDYIKYNLWFRNPTMSLSSKTLFRPGKIAHYASLRDVDIEMAFSASAGPSQPPPAAQPSAQPPPPSTGPTPKAPAVAAAQDIPDELRPAWERLQAFQAQVKLPGKKLHGNGWTLLVENATAKVSAVDIAVRYEARITVCKAEGTDVQYWPSLKTFIDHGDHLLSPATVSTSIPSRSPSHRQEANADATEKRLAAFGQLTQPKPKE